MQVTSKGQVTVPVEIRERLGIQPGTEVEFEIDGDAVVLRKAPGSRRRGRSIVARMRGRATVSMTTDEIMAVTRGSE
ncbi:MAG: AbrB/MazE/SpoVT family DNA-binding domain-containing protein [Acidobacteria bacterium]|nr:MAG: AbrB/MazE/SpoVT family DNA-binding domain-containing protein [Acidobacteriota bacterium]